VIGYTVVVMSPGQIFLSLVGLGQFFTAQGQVSHFSFGVGKFSLKIPNFPIFFPSDKKNCFGLGQKVFGPETVRPLIYCRSKYALLGRVRAHLYTIGKPRD